MQRTSEASIEKPQTNKQANQELIENQQTNTPSVHGKGSEDNQLVQAPACPNFIVEQSRNRCDSRGHRNRSYELFVEDTPIVIEIKQS